MFGQVINLRSWLKDSTVALQQPQDLNSQYLSAHFFQLTFPHTYAKPFQLCIHLCFSLSRYHDVLLEQAHTGHPVRTSIHYNMRHKTKITQCLQFYLVKNKKIQQTFRLKESLSLDICYIVMYKIFCGLIYLNKQYHGLLLLEFY